MKKLLLLRITFLIVIFMILVPAGKVNAIPAFARKYQISCQVCHSPGAPMLKPFGDEFAGNGFRMTEFEAPRYYIPTGDDKLSLFRELPLAFRIDGFATLNFDNAGTVDFGSPFVLKILSGGEISEKLSYYFYFLMDERGEITGVEDAFLMYHDLFKTGVNVYLGQFQASDPLFKGELRLTLEPYQIYAVRPEFSTINLKYDRGVMFDKSFSSGTTIVGEVLNGSGLSLASEGFLFDKDKYKNLMLRVTQDLGKSISLGFFGYTGKELIGEEAAGIPFINQVKMYGPDLTLNIDGKLMLNMQYVWRTDSEVYLNLTDQYMYDVKTNGGFAELIYAPKGDMSKVYFAGLFNLVDSQIDALDYRSATLHIGYLLRRNLRVVAESTYMFGDEPYAKASAGFVTAF